MSFGWVAGECSPCEKGPVTKCSRAKGQIPGEDYSVLRLLKASPEVQKAR